jgi:hypothetical protein
MGYQQATTEEQNPGNEAFLKVIMPLPKNTMHFCPKVQLLKL